MSKVIVGISAFYHDSAVCIVKDGAIAAAAQEERYSRKKHDEGFPSRALLDCLEFCEITPSEIDAVVFYEKPLQKFDRLVETYLGTAPRGFTSFAASLPVWLSDKIFQRRLLTEYLEECLGPCQDWSERLRFSEHHLSHAASAFYPSPFEAASILTLDGVGEWTTTSVGYGEGRRISIDKEIKFPHSLGLLYSAFTYFTGFKVNAGEYKVMGLAPYGQPRFTDAILSNLIDVSDDGSFRLNMEFFDFATGLKMTNERFSDLFGISPRDPESDLTHDYVDLAASIQEVLELVVLRMSRFVFRQHENPNLCLAGGVALNCVANSVILRDGKFSRIWIQPAAGDAGGALGAALSYLHMGEGEERKCESVTDGMSGALLGRSFSEEEVEVQLDQLGAVFESLSDTEMLEWTAERLANGDAVGWFQGRMEFGPRALGNRSIIANPLLPEMQSNLNLKIKFRESFRPFAPSVLVEDSQDWFDLEAESPYMLLVADVINRHRLRVRKSDDRSLISQLHEARSTIPAVTHVDYSARLQTVDNKRFPRFHQLISAFARITGCPLVVNTSFNIRGEPIVASPADAFRCFMGTNLDVLVVGNAILRKSSQDPGLLDDYRHLHELD